MIRIDNNQLGTKDDLCTNEQNRKNHGTLSQLDDDNEQVVLANIGIDHVSTTSNILPSLETNMAANMEEEIVNQVTVPKKPKQKMKSKKKKNANANVSKNH